MLIGRHSSFSGAPRRPLPSFPDDQPRSGLGRRLAYGFAGLCGLAVLGAGAMFVLGTPPERPPASQAPLPAAPRPAPDAPRPAPDADTSAGGTPAALKAVQTQVDSETTLLAAMRDQAEQATGELSDLQSQLATARAGLAGFAQQQDAAKAGLADLVQQQDTARTSLADLQRQQDAAKTSLADLAQQQDAAKASLGDLQRQQDAARMSLADLQRRQDGAKAGLADLQRRQDAAKVALADLQRKQEAARAAVVATAPQAPPRPAVRPPPTEQAALDNAARPDDGALQPAFGRPRAPGTPPGTDGVRQMSPPPSSLGQVSMAEQAGPELARPRIFLHYRTGSEQGLQQATQLARLLLFSDFAYAATTGLPSGATAPLIRYFYPADAEAADRLAALLRGSGLEFRVVDGTGAASGVAPGTIEVWIPS